MAKTKKSAANGRTGIRRLAAPRARARARITAVVPTSRGSASEWTTGTWLKESAADRRNGTARTEAVVTQDHEGDGETRQKTDVGQGIVDEGWLLGERDRTNGDPSKGDERDAESDIREDTANDGEQVGALDPHRDQGDERDGRKGAFLGEEPRCESGEGCHGPEPLAGRRIGGPSEACQREEGEEAGENLGAPRNVGNGFRVHRVNGEEQRGHPGRGGGP